MKESFSSGIFRNPIAIPNTADPERWRPSFPG